MKEEILTLKEALAKAVDKLQQMEVPDADIDAWYLLSYVTGLDRAAFFLHGEEPMAEPDMIRYCDLVTKRGERIPLQHLTGEQEFMGLDFHVNEHVLIPRQDTECLVERVLPYVDGKRVLDVCTGSGCIAIAIAKLGKPFIVHGVDISEEALAVARQNATELNASVELFAGDLMTRMDGQYDVIVSNPPYSIKWAGDENPLLINDPRFAPAGVLAPKSKADLAFIMHSLAWLASNGTAAIVCFPGIMYRGGAEQKIRKYLVDNNFIDCIIQLPSNLFFGTSIATCIMVLKKGKTDNKVLFIDASSECVKVTNNNKLTPENINKIVDTFAQRAEEAHFSHLAEYSEVQENDYNLSVSTYVEAKDTREKIDIVKLNAKIAQIVARENELRAAIDQIVAEIEG